MLQQAKMVKRNWFKIGLFVILAIMLVGSFYEYDTQVRKTFEKELHTRASEDVTYMKEIVEEKLDTMLQLLNSISMISAKYDDLRDPEFLQLLDVNAEANHYMRMAVTLPDGISYTSDGLSHDSNGREYFTKGMLGETYISNVTISRIDNKRVISVSVPMKRGDDIIGVLRCTLDTNALGDILNTQTSSLDGLKGNVIQTNGTIVTMSDDWSHDQYFTYLEDIVFNNGLTTEQLKASFHNHESGHFSYQSDESDRIIYYEPINNTDWMVVTSFPYSIISMRLNATYADVIKLELQLFLIFAIGFAYIFLTERRNYKQFKTVNQKLDAVVTHTPGCILRIRKDNARDISFINEELFHLIGYTKEEYFSLLNGDFVNLVVSEDRDDYIRYFTNYYEYGKTYAKTYRIVHKDGHIIWVFDKRQLIKEGHLNWFYITLVDITESKSIQAKLSISEKRYQMIMEQTMLVTFEWNMKKDEIYFSDLWETMYGYSLYYKDFMNVLHRYDQTSPIVDLLENLIRGAESGNCEVHLRKKDDSYHWCKVIARNLKDDDGYIDTIIGSIEDIDDVKIHTMRLEEKSRVDGLTKLYNKTTIESLIDETLQQPHKHKHALFVIDVDDFKAINDTYGHVCGDEALRKVADGLRTCFRTNDYLGRIGGDEFVVLMRDINGDQTRLIQKKLHTLSEELKKIHIGYDNNFHITCSIGIAVQDASENYHELFRKADKALYQVKEKGKDGFCLTDTD